MSHSYATCTLYMHFLYRAVLFELFEAEFRWSWRIAQVKVALKHRTGGTFLTSNHTVTADACTPSLLKVIRNSQYQNGSRPWPMKDVSASRSVRSHLKVQLHLHNKYHEQSFWWYDASKYINIYFAICIICIICWKVLGYCQSKPYVNCSVPYSNIRPSPLSFNATVTLP